MVTIFSLLSFSAQLFHTDVNELRECLAPLKVEEKGLIFIPVNNNSSIESAGGTLPLHIKHVIHNPFHNQDPIGRFLYLREKLGNLNTMIRTTT